jgi:hypothetical protein
MLKNNELSIRTRSERRHLKKTDDRLLTMPYIQIILFTIIAFPIFIQRIYITVTMNKQKSDIEVTIENFVFNLVLLLSFLTHGMPFYIYTPSGGKTFQKAIFNVIRCIY